MKKGIFHLVVKGIELQGAEVTMLEQRSADNVRTGFYEIRYKLQGRDGQHYYGMHPDLETASMLFDEACAIALPRVANNE